MSTILCVAVDSNSLPFVCSNVVVSSVIMTKGKRAWKDPKSEGEEVTCYICNSKFARVCDLKGRH